jgi:hypothetical protein
LRAEEIRQLHRDNSGRKVIVRVELAFSCTESGKGAEMA